MVMTTPTTETNGTQRHRARGNGAEASQLGSRKVYVLGRTHEMRVPMREVTLSATRTPTGQTEANPPIRLYDTSGPYTDPTFTPDLHHGLTPQRLGWILGRGDVEELTTPSDRSCCPREDDT